MTNRIQHVDDVLVTRDRGRRPHGAWPSTLSHKGPGGRGRARGFSGQTRKLVEPVRQEQRQRSTQTSARPRARRSATQGWRRRRTRPRFRRRYGHPDGARSEARPRGGPTSPSVGAVLRRHRCSAPSSWTSRTRTGKRSSWRSRTRTSRSRPRLSMDGKSVQGRRHAVPRRLVVHDGARKPEALASTSRWTRGREPERCWASGR